VSAHQDLVRPLRASIAQWAWIVIMLLTGGFQFYRGAAPDGIVFTALAAALILDALHWMPAFRAREWRPSRTLLVIALGIAAAVLALTPRHGLADSVVLIVSGALVLIVAWPDHSNGTGRPAWTPRMRRSATLWAAVGIAVCLWELAMYFLGTYVPGGRDDFPALSDLLDPLIQNPIGRVLFVAMWLLGGVALARRGRAR
jgi:hypothetical protein